jgi:hypothetical protein
MTTSRTRDRALAKALMKVQVKALAQRFPLFPPFGIR